MAHIVPTTKAAVLALLQAAPELADVQVRYAPPTEEQDITFSMIWLGTDVEIDDDWVELGARRRRMTFRLPITLVSLYIGDDVQAAEATSWDMFDTVVRTLRADPTLGSSVRQFDAIPSSAQAVPVGANKWEASIEAKVVCISHSY